MIYIFRSKNSTGARELAEGITLLGTLARRTKGLALRTLQNGDSVVCWGDRFAVPAGINVKVLNNIAPLSKFHEAQKLAEAGVPTIQVSRTKPADQPARAAERPMFPMRNYRGIDLLSEAQVKSLVAQLNAHLQAPLPVAQPAATWLARNNNHVGGNDLLEGRANADYYSKKEEIVEEYRVHLFNGKSIRAGKKIQQRTRPDGRTAPHQWIRSFDAGWNIVYDGFASTKEMRAIAKKAVEALGLHFAAVDIAKKADGSLIVLEVNRAPGCEGGTVTAYAKKIVAWHKGQEQNDEE